MAGRGSRLYGGAAAVAQPLPDEAGVRAALDRCVAAWNRHVPKAFADACVTDDVWFTEADDSVYRRFKGREKMLGLFDYNIRNTDLEWQIVGLQALPDGAVAAQLKQRIGVLPRKQGKYAQSFDSDPSYARLRRDGKRWKVFFFTSDTGWARALLASPDAFPADEKWGWSSPPQTHRCRPAPSRRRTCCRSAFTCAAAARATAGRRRRARIRASGASSPPAQQRPMPGHCAGRCRSRVLPRWSRCWPTRR